MPSEQRLHPASILFSFGQSLKRFALPGLLVLFTARSSSGPAGSFGRLPPNWELWIMLLLIPSAFVALARYLSFRLRYEGTELVIRSGIFFRNERHVPYARIQNLDAVQNVFHRLLRVTEVRVETAASKEPEATISVLPAAAFEEMRRRVFESRVQTGAAPEGRPEAEAPARAAAAGETLLQLPLRELLLYGFLENRGLVVIGAVYGVLWELGLLDAVWNRIFDDPAVSRGIVGEVLSTLASGERLSLTQIGVALAGIAGLLVIVRLASMGWAAVRLYGFRLTRADEDVRTEFGLFTRVAATIPLRRIQTITIRETLMHRFVGRLSVRVETAGGTLDGTATKEREWLAPVIRPAELARLAQRVMPELDLGSVSWHPAAPGAFRRAVKPAIVRAIAISVLIAALLGWWASAVLGPIVVVWAVFSAWKYVDRLGWAETNSVVVFRSGWLLRRVTAARMAKIQAVTLVETPFDRWTAMARVRVDTAGASERSHRVDIPYLSRETARGLHLRLAAHAASMAFRW